MAKSRNTPRKPKPAPHPKQPDKLLNQLQPADTVLVLQRLLAAHPELIAEAGKIAHSTLCEVSFESVATDVEDSIRQLNLDDLNGRAGRHSWGYTEPSEAAWELLQEAVDPFVEDLKRYLGLGLEEAAFEMCKGIVLGLYNCRDSGEGELLGWAEDFPAEAAGNAMAECFAKRSSGPRLASIHESVVRQFVDQYVPEWQWISKQISDHTRS